MRRPRLGQALKKDKWVRPFLRQYRGALALALFLGFLTFFCAGALMFSSGYLISRAAEMPGNVMLIYVPVILTRAFGIGRPAFHYAERLVSHNWVLRMTSLLRLKLYGILEKEAVFFSARYRMGDVLGLLAEDIGHIQNLYLRTIFPTIIAWLVYVFIVAALGLFSLWLALAMLLLLGVLVLVFPLVSVLANSAAQARRKQAKNRLYEELTDHVLGVADWIYARREKDCLAGHEKTAARLAALDEALARRDRRRALAMQLIFGLVALVLLLWAGGYFGGVRGGSANWVAAFVLAFFPLIDAFAPLPAAVQEAGVYADSLRRLNALPESAPAKLASPELAPPQGGGEGAPAALPENSGGAPQALALGIEDVTFRYPGAARDVLSGLSLCIRPGEKLAILGHSGAGKSTLAALIRGDLLPVSGRVTLNGVPTSQFEDAITRYIGVVQQKPYLFGTTLLNNLRVGRQSATEGEVWQVLEKVGLGGLPRRLPEGLQTQVDEAGLRFSGGERQRLALARVLLMDVPIIVLDEPTVGLDPLTEQALLETFFQNLAGKTVVWITHHLQGAGMMDRVVFIENGRLGMDGAPGELLKTNAHYQKLCAIDRGAGQAR